MCYYSKYQIITNNKNKIKKKKKEIKDIPEYLLNKKEFYTIPFNKYNNDSIDIVRWVGPKSKEIFRRNNIYTIQDLYNWRLHHLNSQDFIHSFGIYPNKIYAHLKWTKELYL